MMYKFLMILAVVIGSIFIYQSRQEKVLPIDTTPLQIDQPLPYAKITSPVTISGKAPGTWFFEGQMTVKIESMSGTIIAQTPVLATGEWMTTELVDFTSTLVFTVPTGNIKGNLIFEKANPSGLPENAAHITLPVFFE